MNGLTLKHLRYFVALAEHRHFANAADVCAISQPALSLQIKQLEELAGVPLVERNTRSVLLTPLGKIVAKHGQEVLRAVEELDDLMRAAQDTLSGPFNLGAIPTIAPYMLPTLVKTLGSAFPQMELIMRETVTEQILEELHAGKLDAALVALPLNLGGLKEVPIFTENIVLARPALQSDQLRPSVNALSDMNLLLLEEGHCFREQALEFCAIDKSSYRSIMDGSSLTTLVQLVEAGVGVTLLPQMAVALETRSSNVEITDFADPQPTRTIGMVWRDGSPLDNHFQRIADVISENCSNK